jgi:DNA polymerase-4/DNA polymerase V
VRTILHIDGDAFFASCEQARDRRLQGKPVVTGHERGIAAAFSYEAKARGIRRGMPIQEVRRICPEAVIVPSDYDLYRTISRRFFAMVRRYTDRVEEYGIDEGFAEITGFDESGDAIAKDIQRALVRELGVSFSIGIGPTKVLAKIGSRWNKPNGLTAITEYNRMEFLKNLPVGEVWGIGPQTSRRLVSEGILTAHDFAQKTLPWIARMLAKPYQELWYELRGVSVLPLALASRADPLSIQTTRSFAPIQGDFPFLASQLAKNIENACARAREKGLAPSRAGAFFKDRGFNYTDVAFALPYRTNAPTKIIETASALLKRRFDPGRFYRATGVTLIDLKIARANQLDLFGEQQRTGAEDALFATVDAINRRHGPETIHLAASAIAREDSRVNTAPSPIISRKRLVIPFLMGNDHP